MIAKIVFLSAFFDLFTSSLYIILYAAGRIKENMYANIITGLTSFALIVYLVRWHHSAISSVCVSSGWKFMSGMVFKPLLLHYIADFSFRDFRPMFILSFEALFICAAIGFAVRVLMPSGLGWAIPSCAIIAVANALAMYFLVVPATMQGQLHRVISRVPRIGKTGTALLSAGVRLFHPLRTPFQMAAGL